MFALWHVPAVCNVALCPVHHVYDGLRRQPATQVRTSRGKRGWGGLRLTWPSGSQPGTLLRLPAGLFGCWTGDLPWRVLVGKVACCTCG
jgi:hypothetical protein